MAPKKREASTSTPVFVAGWLQRVVVCATTESSDISSDEEEKEKHMDISLGSPIWTRAHRTTRRCNLQVKEKPTQRLLGKAVSSQSG